MSVMIFKAILSLYLLTSAILPAQAASAGERVEEIDQQIMLEEISLARFNLKFHQAANHKDFYQEWLYPMTREAGTALRFANTMVDLRQRAGALKNPSRISRHARKLGIEAGLIGQAITGLSSSSALGINLANAQRAAREGYSPKHSTATVLESSKKIDLLLASRDAVIDNEKPAGSDYMYALKRRLLEHIRNQLVFEFKFWSAHSRGTEWAENTFYAIDAAQGFTQLGASCTGLKAFTAPTLGGSAAITSLVGNSMVMFNPIVRSTVGGTMAKWQRHQLDKVFPRAKPLGLNEVLAEWDDIDAKAILDTADTLETKELAFLIRRSGAIDGTIDKELQRAAKLRRIADQQAVSGPLIGLAGVARSVISTSAYYINSNDIKTNGASSTHGRLVANQMNFAGRIVQSTGQAYSLVLTPVTEIRHYFYKRQIQRAGKTPAQLEEKELAQLDVLERRIKKSHF